ncbi:sugar transferase [Halorussus gelatinilyticus]|uniref:Sugar transferase n=1 Tax=Halorussus gelatinilyticus TaxID=2937524 RepID=A0A8U0IKT1_9EURY|nr:sugar transferase [Halorussus gelatinilyticus]UPW01286.1 sugar transferase [Halorussus gelatinilyticus]
MVSGFRYRVVSVVGAAFIAAIAVLMANASSLQTLFTTAVPVFRRLPPTVLTGNKLTLVVVTTTLVVVGSLMPLFKPRPRRILDTILLAQRRTVTACLALATIGYFDYTYRLPRSTLVLATIGLLIGLPAWFVAIRRRPVEKERAVIVGDDSEEIADVLDEIDVPVVGYVSPPSPYYTGHNGVSSERAVTDGSGEALLEDLDCLSGLSRLEEVLVDYNVDTVVLAFAQPDRAEFFGALDTCYEHGVDAKVHREHADDVLTTTTRGDEVLVDVELEPWDWQDYVFKRGFDGAFASVGLLAFAPFLVVIAVAIKIDSPGPILYSQERTAEFGDTFTVYKFRTMIPEDESVMPIEDEANDRITRVGRFLRKTHLDEVPQLWSILVGEMSVVGPRAVWTDEEQLLEETTDMWRKRWFVKPGLTGLAQINDAKSTDPAAKLRYDLEYIRRQSFWLDVKIVVRQIWKVFADAL